MVCVGMSVCGQPVVAFDADPAMLGIELKALQTHVIQPCKRDIEIQLGKVCGGTVSAIQRKNSHEVLREAVSSCQLEILNELEHVLGEPNPQLIPNTIAEKQAIVAIMAHLDSVPSKVDSCLKSADDRYSPTPARSAWGGLPKGSDAQMNQASDLTKAIGTSPKKANEQSATAVQNYGISEMELNSSLDQSDNQMQDSINGGQTAPARVTDGFLDAPDTSGLSTSSSRGKSSSRSPTKARQQSRTIPSQQPSQTNQHSPQQNKQPAQNSMVEPKSQGHWTVLQITGAGLLPGKDGGKQLEGKALIAFDLGPSSKFGKDFDTPNDLAAFLKNLELKAHQAACAGAPASQLVRPHLWTRGPEVVVLESNAEIDQLRQKHRCVGQPVQFFTNIDSAETLCLDYDSKGLTAPSFNVEVQNACVD